MNIYEMNNEKLMQVSSDFNNTNYGRKIWLYSRTPELVGFLALVIYILLTIVGALHAELKNTVSMFVVSDLVVVCISFILYGFAEVNYWKQVNKYVNSLNNNTKEVVVKKEKILASSKNDKKVKSGKTKTVKKGAVKDKK